MSKNTFMPQEFHVLADSFVVRTRVAPENVTDDEVLKTARRNRLAAGDSVLLQCMDFDYGVVLAEITYRVTKRVDGVRSVEDHDGGMKQVNEIDMEVKPTGDWIDYRAVKPRRRGKKAQAAE